MKLTLEEITYLGKIFEEKNEIGLFSNISVPLKGDEERSLIKKGVLDNNGFVMGMDGFLNIISKPDRVCRFVAQIGYLVVEKYSYWKDNKTVLAENSEGAFTFSINSDLKAVKGQMVDLYGGSNLRTTSLSYSMQANELMAFTALVDLYRKEEMLNYLLDNQPKNTFSFEEIEQYIQKPLKNGLLTFVQKNFKNFSAPVNLKNAIFELKKKSILSGDSDVGFNFESMLFAKNFLLIHSVSLLEVFNLKNDVLTVFSAVFLNSSVHDVLKIHFADNNVLIFTVTSKEQIDEIIWALSCPELIGQNQHDGGR